MFLVVYDDELHSRKIYSKNCKRVKEIRSAKSNGTYKINDSERYKLARLGALRIWGLKKAIQLNSKLEENKRREPKETK